MRPMGILFFAFTLVSFQNSITLASPKHDSDGSIVRLTKQQRADAIARAQVWFPTDTANKNLREGPRHAGHAKPGDTIECTYDAAAEQYLGGNTPKFKCITKDGHEYRIKYGRHNAEVFASVIATRIFWALGFGADVATPVTVICHKCSVDPWNQRDPTRATVTFKDAAAMKNLDEVRLVLGHNDSSGWGWNELDDVSEQAGGAPVAQRDALKLLAAMIQHGDSGYRQQRLVCLSQEPTPDAPCRVPFMYVHDLGSTFAKTGTFVRKLNLDQWKNQPVWKDADNCIANVTPNMVQGGGLREPKISEQGREFLVSLLGQLSHQQLIDAFTVARITEYDSKHTAEDWVKVFEQKEDEITHRPPCK